MIGSATRGGKLDGADRNPTDGAFIESIGSFPPIGTNGAEEAIISTFPLHSSKFPSNTRP